MAEAQGIPVRVAHSLAGWIMRDANGDVVTDEFDEAYLYATRDAAEAAMASFRIGT